ncbi:hypothetical protein PUNSTDRAFT_137682 [Punctularia strigosozonata HHB-11173 SS5]|uniref:uncharacterized protein n=1 Tax=Punctularia strigosozonata (strain HHB-11173) TaxID=741275 RepID=UPI0004417C35|nr:uncharacterized protein PUNSTDRAFT_137682 [Punctularia strigosozonata HHB-11173 SS5]EIN05578.1 hypothetical protein PUNSTDRAFT_137682 [Punctularia strigosozonata HHB-11173 SS5]
MRGIEDTGAVGITGAMWHERGISEACGPPFAIARHRPLRTRRTNDPLHAGSVTPIHRARKCTHPTPEAEGDMRAIPSQLINAHAPYMHLPSRLRTRSPSSNYLDRVCTPLARRLALVGQPPHEAKHGHYMTQTSQQPTIESGCERIREAASQQWATRRTLAATTSATTRPAQQQEHHSDYGAMLDRGAPMHDDYGAETQFNCPSSERLHAGHRGHRDGWYNGRHVARAAWAKRAVPLSPSPAIGHCEPDAPTARSMLAASHSSLALAIARTQLRTA